VSKASVATYTASRIANRVTELGRQISKECRGRRLDVVITMNRGFMFGADLVRAIDIPVALHFLREDVRDVEQGGKVRREVFFGDRATVSASKERPALKGRDVLLVDAVLDSGIIQDFLLRRIGESGPRSLRLAVLLDKTSKRRVALEPDYFGFRTASNEVWTGYGLSEGNELGPSGKHLVAGKPSKRKSSKKRNGKK
jgi:hypoxanthine phosphoribosyltransferase